MMKNIQKICEENEQVHNPKMKNNNKIKQKRNINSKSLKEIMQYSINLNVFQWDNRKKNQLYSKICNFLYFNSKEAITVNMMYKKIYYYMEVELYKIQ